MCMFWMTSRWEEELCYGDGGWRISRMRRRMLLAEAAPRLLLVSARIWERGHLRIQSCKVRNELHRKHTIPVRRYVMRPLITR